MEVIVLMGIKHCGKSTQGRLLSQKLNYTFYDTDDIITDLTGKTPRQIFTHEGEQAFKNAELEACRFLVRKITAENECAVIATGGGICNNPPALEELHSVGKFIFLKAQESIACSRILREVKEKKDGTFSGLPAYIADKNPASIQDVKNIFHDFFERRVKLYSEIADETVEMADASKEENTSQILDVV